MLDRRDQIAHLKKVTLLLWAGRSAEAMDLLSGPHQMEFIFGIGPGGLTPFECEMAGHRVGDAVHMAAGPAGIHDLFGHLAVLLPGLPAGEDRIHLQLRVGRVAEAGPKEVIRALAELASCGDHCCGGG